MDDCLPYGLLAGDQQLTATDDGASPALVKLPEACPFFGSEEDTVYVSVNTSKNPFEETVFGETAIVQFTCKMRQKNFELVQLIVATL